MNRGVNETPLVDIVVKIGGGVLAHAHHFAATLTAIAAAGRARIDRDAKRQSDAGVASDARNEGVILRNANGVVASAGQQADFFDHLWTTRQYNSANWLNVVFAKARTFRYVWSGHSSAHADGEPDPFYYLRDEFEAQGHISRDHHQERP